MKPLPLQLLCSTKFGRYPKISLEQAWNMFQSDNWMINYAGYKRIIDWTTIGFGRGIFYSSRLNQIFAVIGNTVYVVGFQNNEPIYNSIGTLSTDVGDVFIDENLKSQVAICDKNNIYIYDYSTGVFVKLALDFSAGYITYQDNRFIASINSVATSLTTPITPGWRLSDFILLAIGSAIPAFGYAGSGYHVNDVLTVTGGHNDGTVTVATIDGGGGITSLTVAVDGSGSGYGNLIYPVTGGHGTGAKVQVTVTSGFAAKSTQIGTFQSKPDNVVACVRVPGKTGQVLIMGSIVSEIWTDVGLQLFPYQRNASYCLDYGCLNPATIATGDDFVVWLAANEKSGPVIMYCAGGAVQPISTDGINYRLSQLTNPKNSFGFVFKQDGHVFYQLTFPIDNVTYTYDFITQKFYTLSDGLQNCHIAKRVAYCNNTYYFIAYNDNNLYELSSKYTTYSDEYGNPIEIPRIIITPTSALPDRSVFVINNVTFPIEQGNDSEEGSRVDLSVSSDGGSTFGNPVGMMLNSNGQRRNIFKFYNLGRFNEVIFQLRFWGIGRFVLTNGVAEVVQ